MECSIIPARLIATCFALIAFAATTVVGLAAGNTAGTILERALIAMVACWIVGRIVGLIATHAVQDHVEKYKSENPIPTDDAAAADATPAAAPPAGGTTA